MTMDGFDWGEMRETNPGMPEIPEHGAYYYP
jgi:hypothetical protein